MTSFSLPKRVAVIGILFLVPISILFYSVYKSETRDILFVEKEIKGLQVTKAITSGLLSLTQIVTADGADSSRLSKLFADQKHALEEIEEKYTQFSNEMMLTKEALEKTPHGDLSTASLQERITAVKNAVSFSAENATRELSYIRLFEWFLLSLEYVADQSNLMLDPDSDSFYLMSNIIITLPAAISQLIELDLKQVDSTSSKMGAESPFLMRSLETFVKNTKNAVFYDAQFWGARTELQSSGPQQIETITAAKRVLSQLLESKKVQNLSGIPVNGLPLAKQLERVLLTQSEFLEDQLLTRKAFLIERRSFKLVLNLILTLVAALVAFLLQRSFVTSAVMSTKRLFDNAAHLHETSKRLTEASRNLNYNTHKETAAIQQTVSALTQMSSMLGQTASHSASTAELASNMLEKSSAGLETMASLKNAMDQIGESNVRMREMRRIIGEVGSKTEVINEIVFKTQLLAVNASIEAARAGHLGKGFAVVAGEVSNLAALSGKAATEIRNLVERSTVQVDEIADYIGESIERGAAVTVSAQNSFNYLSESISEITARVQQIDEATREQNVGVNQTSEAMTELNSVAMATSQTTVEAAEQSEKVLKVSRAINDIAIEMSRLLSSSPLEYGIAPERAPEPKASVYGGKGNQVETIGESAKFDVTVKSGISGSLNRAKNQATVKLKARIISTTSTQKSGLKSKFEWHDKYDIGVPSMNNEHKEILRLMRELESAYQEDKPFATQMSLVQELGAYATKHFEDEEAFMKSIHYSDLENHKSIHKNLLSRYGGLSSEFQKNGVISEEFFGFLRSWLVAHIMGVDIKYGEVATQNKAAA